MSQFKSKLSIDEFINKRQSIEHSLKINLSEELRYLNIWINEYEELAQYEMPSQSS